MNLPEAGDGSIMSSAAQPSRHSLHMAVADAGKRLALKGRHDQALTKYREALRLAFAASAPQVFPRHYLHCVIESLERSGAYAQAAALAGEAASVAVSPDDTPFHRRDRAHLLERQGVNRLKAGETAAARTTLAAALALDSELPLARSILDWTARGLSVSPTRLAEAQHRHRYFIVRADLAAADRTSDDLNAREEVARG